jgi:SAM-dependent methyltransferase
LKRYWLLEVQGRSPCKQRNDTLVPALKTTLTLSKSIIKNLFLDNRLIASASRRHLRQAHDPEKDEASYPLTVFHRHLTALEPLRGNLLGADVLEIGPGSNLGFGLLALLAGANSATCVDDAALAQQGSLAELYPALVKTAATYPETYLVAPALLERATQDAEGLAKELLGRVSYRAPLDFAKNTLPAASLDVICSHTCFEHFADPAEAIAQIARLLRPGGVTSHQIDLRDHRDFDHPLEFLTYNETLWRLANSNHPHAVRTRWRASQYRAAFEKQGLEVLYLEVTHKMTVTEDMRRRFARRFQQMDLADLGILGLLVVARKREQARAR